MTVSTSFISALSVEAGSGMAPEAAKAFSALAQGQAVVKNVAASELVTEWWRSR